MCVRVQTYTSLTVGQFYSLKHALCRFLQDRRVKVSLFLQDGLQNLDGTMVLVRDGPVPPGSELPGAIRCVGSACLPALLPAPRSCVCVCVVGRQVLLWGRADFLGCH